MTQRVSDSVSVPEEGCGREEMRTPDQGFGREGAPSGTVASLDADLDQSDRFLREV